MLKEIIEKNVGATRDAPRTYIGASGIGNECYRAIWYSYRHADKAQITPTQQLTFSLGHAIEQMVIEILKLKYTIDTQVSLVSREVKEFKGHADGYIDELNMLLEIKTAKNSRFNEFKRKGLKLWSEGYYAQVQAYMGMLAADVISTCVIVFNKDTSEIAEEVVRFDEKYYEALEEKARIIRDAEEAPPRISENASFYKCKMCFYREFCHV